MTRIPPPKKHQPVTKQILLVDADMRHSTEQVVTVVKPLFIHLKNNTYTTVRNGGGGWGKGLRVLKVSHSSTRIYRQIVYTTNIDSVRSWAV